MPCERVDYYSDDEFQAALIAEEQAWWDFEQQQQEQKLYRVMCVVGKCIKNAMSQKAIFVAVVAHRYRKQMKYHYRSKK